MKRIVLWGKADWTNTYKTQLQWAMRQWIPRGAGDRSIWEPQRAKGSLGRQELLRAAVNVTHSLISVTRLFSCSHSRSLAAVCVLPLGNEQNCHLSILIWSHFDIKIDKVPFKSQPRHLLSVMFFSLILNGKNSMECLSWSFTKISTAGATTAFSWWSKGLHSKAYKQ